MKEEKDD